MKTKQMWTTGYDFMRRAVAGNHVHFILFFCITDVCLHGF